MAHVQGRKLLIGASLFLPRLRRPSTRNVIAPLRKVIGSARKASVHSLNNSIPSYTNPLQIPYKYSRSQGLSFTLNPSPVFDVPIQLYLQIPWNKTPSASQGLHLWSLDDRTETRTFFVSRLSIRVVISLVFPGPRHGSIVVLLAVEMIKSASRVSDAHLCFINRKTRYHPVNATNTRNNVLRNPAIRRSS
ncbi:hypothetical protein JAAARDRAFT_78123 [Jaapia argillacea MUCL 33604]|uniref:Uncharacterized protein n=1 Tax=Jaapia argillacea MUCL 33604 TaxID=933084 RepID=A0A067PU55_9AGAM|nr:hypothetical protein JAAARDRAFT_78123 [Jaapia argillacea MUCL 33604]